jgi:hypothetical protein
MSNYYHLLDHVPCNNFYDDTMHLFAGAKDCFPCGGNANENLELHVARSRMRPKPHILPCDQTQCDQTQCDQTQFGVPPGKCMSNNIFNRLEASNIMRKSHCLPHPTLEQVNQIMRAQKCAKTCFPKQGQQHEMFVGSKGTSSTSGVGFGRGSGGSLGGAPVNFATRRGALDVRQPLQFSFLNSETNQ